VLVLRAQRARPRERRGKVLFIDADADYRAGPEQNYLEPEHLEKVVHRRACTRRARSDSGRA